MLRKLLKILNQQDPNFFLFVLLGNVHKYLGGGGGAGKFGGGGQKSFDAPKRGGQKSF